MADFKRNGPRIKQIVHFAMNDPRDVPMPVYYWTDGLITWTKFRDGVEQPLAPMTGDCE